MFILVKLLARLHRRLVVVKGDLVGEDCATGNKSIGVYRCFDGRGGEVRS